VPLPPSIGAAAASASTMCAVVETGVSRKTVGHQEIDGCSHQLAIDMDRRRANRDRAVAHVPIHNVVSPFWMETRSRPCRQDLRQIPRRHAAIGARVFWPPANATLQPLRSTATEVVNEAVPSSR